MKARSSKVQNWRVLLNQYIDANRTLTHSFNPELGKDCVRWTVSAMYVVSDVRYGLMDNAKYKTERGALAYLMRHKCDSLHAIARKAWGEPIPITMAGAGDPVLADLDKLGLSGGQPQGLGLSMGICNGRMSYFVGEKGLVEVPTLSLEFCHYG